MSKAPTQETKPNIQKDLSAIASEIQIECCGDDRSMSEEFRNILKILERHFREQQSALLESHKELVKSAEHFLRHDGSSGSLDYDASELFYARENLKSALAKAKEITNGK